MQLWTAKVDRKYSCIYFSYLALYVRLVGLVPNCQQLPGFGKKHNHVFFLWLLPEVIISAKSAKRYVDLRRCFGKLGLKSILLMKLKSIGYLGVHCKSFSQLRGHIGCSRCQLDSLFSSLLFTGTDKASLGRCSAAHIGAMCWWQSVKTRHLLIPLL